MRFVQKEFSLCRQKYFLTTATKKDQWPKIVILLLKKLRQEDDKWEASLSYVARPCLKNKQNGQKSWLCSRETLSANTGGAGLALC